MTSFDDKAKTATVRIACVDAHAIYRTGIHCLPQDEFEVVAEGETAADLLQIAENHRPDVITLDLAIQGGGAQALAQICRAWPSIKVVVLTASEQADDISTALRLGARGYIHKSIGIAALADAMRTIVKGQVYLSPYLGAKMVRHAAARINGDDEDRRSEVRLTSREQQILDRVSLGETNKEIARSLNIGEKTVKYYMTNIMQKLGVRNRVEAVLIARNRQQMAKSA